MHCAAHSRGTGKAVFSLCLLAAASGAEIIDRIAVTVGNQVITETEILREIRLNALLDCTAPNLSPDYKREVAEKLVDQALIRRELDASYAGVTVNPADPVVDTMLRQQFPEQAAYRKALQQQRLSDREVRQRLAWQLTVLRFLEARFRPGVQVPEAEMRDYYEKNIAAKAARNGGETLPAFEDVRVEIENILASRRTNQALDRWIGQTRTQTRVKFREEAFQ
ncbi:MAG: hypothetical protein HYS04_01660 [Acidobacteria bacterium]|nr:hypothetical protein [Acidobacteriota bacterium]